MIIPSDTLVHALHLLTCPFCFCRGHVVFRCFFCMGHVFPLVFVAEAMFVFPFFVGVMLVLYLFNAISFTHYVEFHHIVKKGKII